MGINIICCNCRLDVICLKNCIESDDTSSVKKSNNTSINKQLSEEEEEELEKDSIWKHMVKFNNVLILMLQNSLINVSGLNFYSWGEKLNNTNKVVNICKRNHKRFWKL